MYIISLSSFSNKKNCIFHYFPNIQSDKICSTLRKQVGSLVRAGQQELAGSELQ